MEDKVHLTVFINKNQTQEQLQKNPEKALINKLVEINSYLEDRIASLEKMILGKEGKRAIKIEYRD